MTVKKSKSKSTAVDAVGVNARSALDESPLVDRVKGSKSDWCRWFRLTLAASPEGWLFVSVNLPDRLLRNDPGIGSRNLVMGNLSGTRNKVLWCSEWSAVWSKFFTKLKTFELNGFARKNAKKIEWFAVYENETRKADLSACPTHSHLCVRTPDGEETDAFVRRFGSAFNTYVYPLKVTADSKWIWDVKRSRDGAVLVIVKKRDDELAGYMTKQITTYGMSERIELGGMKKNEN